MAPSRTARGRAAGLVALLALAAGGAAAAAPPAAAAAPGAGATVAVVDTGVARVPDLAGRLIAGPDFSGEGDSTADGFGHGTVMAGLIAGDGTASGGAHTGVAPGASIVSVKVAGADGSTTVPTVVAGLHWVDQHAASAGIEVALLAWGIPAGSPGTARLHRAVEQLAADGVTVVVSAGNTGPAAGSVTTPGDDPAVLSVGAADDAGTTDPTDDTVASWSAVGAGPLSGPDVLASGRSLVGAAAPGSLLWDRYPGAQVDGAYLRGSGTSQAAAVTAGLAADLQASSGPISPFGVRRVLSAAATPLAGVPAAVQGAGELDPGRLLTSGVSTGPAFHLPSAPGASAPAGPDGDSWSGDSWSGDSWSADSWSGRAVAGPLPQVTWRPGR